MTLRILSWISVRSGASASAGGQGKYSLYLCININTNEAIFTIKSDHFPSV